MRLALLRTAAETNEKGYLHRCLQISTKVVIIVNTEIHISCLGFSLRPESVPYERPQAPFLNSLYLNSSTWRLVEARPLNSFSTLVNNRHFVADFDIPVPYYHHDKTSRVGRGKGHFDADFGISVEQNSIIRILKVGREIANTPFTAFLTFCHNIGELGSYATGKGRVPLPNQMICLPFILGKLCCNFFYNGYGCIYARRYEGQIV